MEEDTEQLTTSKSRQATQIEDADANSSAIISRYGRTHKPKHISEDFLATDRRISSVLAKRSTGSQSPEGDLDDTALADETMTHDIPSEDNTDNGGGGMSEDNADVSFNVGEDIGDDMTMADDGPEFLPGDLMWGRVGNHPFWPCMILIDPDFGSYYKTSGLGRLQYHVIFYGDKGRRSWVGSGAILRFLGKDEMEMQVAGITPELKRKDPKWYSGFFVKDQVRARWEAAVEEAEGAMPMTRDERADAFFQCLPPKPPRKSLSAPRKGDPSDASETAGNPDETVSPESVPPVLDEKSGTEAESSPKKSDKELTLSPSLPPPPPVKRGRGRPKKEPEAADSPKESKENKDSKGAKESKQLTPGSHPTRKRKLLDDYFYKKKPSGASKEELPDTSSEITKEVKKRRKSKTKKVESDFEAYREKQIDRFMEDHPDLSPDEIEKYMRKSWISLSDSQKAKYQHRLAKSTPAQSSGSDGSAGGESSGEDQAVEEDADQSSSKEATDNGDASQDQASSMPTSKRKPNIFRGFRFERVCQVCELPGKTVKCRGCSSVFHRDCVYNEDGGNESSDDSDRKSKKRRRSKKPEPKAKAEPVPQPVKKAKRTTAEDIYVAVVNESDSDFDPADSDAAQVGETTVDIMACILGDVTAEPQASIVVDVTSDEETPDEEENAASGIPGGPGCVMAEMANRAKAAAPEDFRCMDCVVGRVPLCFCCGKATDPSGDDSNRYRCGTGYCGKHYHAECLKMWPQSSYTISSGSVQVTTCPQHVCHTCASDDLRETKRKALNERLVRCVRCPTAYHYGNYCLPAGSEVLTSTQIICPRHYETTKKGRHHINASWCFICSMGGSLICCDHCPSSFHADCLQISPPSGSFICEDCESGRFPLYHEVVWVKLGTYRWWPAYTMFPTEIPDNIKNMSHSKGEFAVRFLGTNDYFWISRGRCFLYQEGDSESRKMGRSQVDGVFRKALLEAQELHKQQKELKATRDAEARPYLIKPPSYKKIKTNKPVGNVKMFEPDKSHTSACECDPNAAHPCSPDSDCLNRILLVECDPSICAAGSRCENQCFDKRQYPPLEPWLTEGRGWGLRTLADIKKGSFVIEYVGEIIDDEEFKARMARKHKEKDENYYFLTIDSNRMIDAGPKGNLARFMNHSCQPNCETQKWTVAGDTRVGLFALRDIPAESELTFNYNLESQGFDKKPCKCGAEECVGLIGAKKTKPAPPPVEPTTTKKKGRKSRSIEACFLCGSEGDKMVTCDNKACSKLYHLGCADLKTIPNGKWLCARHKCHTCGKRTQQNCASCILAYCTQHSEGNLTSHPVHGLVCKTHEKNPGRPSVASEGERSTSPNVAKQAREEEKRRNDELRKQKEGERRKKEEQERASRRSRRERIASAKGERGRRKRREEGADAPSEASSEDLALSVPAMEDASDDEKSLNKDIKLGKKEVEEEVERKVHLRNEFDLKTEDSEKIEDPVKNEPSNGDEEEGSSDAKEPSSIVGNDRIVETILTSETEGNNPTNPVCSESETPGIESRSHTNENDLPTDSVEKSEVNVSVEDCNAGKTESTEQQQPNSAESAPSEVNPAPVTPNTPTLTKKSEIPVVGSSKRKFRGKDPTRGTATINRLSLTRKDAKEVKGGPFDKSRLSTELEDLARSFGSDESKGGQASPKTALLEKKGKDFVVVKEDPRTPTPKRSSKMEKAHLNTELDDLVESFASELQAESKKTSKKNSKSRTIEDVEKLPAVSRDAVMTTPVASKGAKGIEKVSLLSRAKSPPGRKTPCSPISLNGGSPEGQLSAAKLLAMQRAKGLKVMPPNRHLSSAREKSSSGMMPYRFSGTVQRPNKGLKILKGQRPEPELSPTSGTDSDAMSPPMPRKGLRLGLSKVASVKDTTEEKPIAPSAESQGSAEPERLKSPVQNGSSKKKASLPSKKSTKDLGVCPLWNQDILNILH